MGDTARGRTQAQAAALLGVKQSPDSRCESPSRSNPTLTTLARPSRRNPCSTTMAPHSPHTLPAHEREVRTPVAWSPCRAR